MVKLIFFIADFNGMDVTGGIINFFTVDFNVVGIWGVGRSSLGVSPFAFLLGVFPQSHSFPGSLSLQKSTMKYTTRNY